MAGFPTLASVEKHPIEDTILGFTESLEHLGEKFPQEVVIGCFLESKLTDVIHID